MEKRNKVVIAIITVIVLTVIVIVVLRSLPKPAEWKPDVELFNPGVLQIYYDQNRTRWMVDLPIAYNRMCFAEHESHGCIMIQYEICVEFTEGENETHFTEYRLMESPPEGMQRIHLIEIPYETRQPTHAYLVDVHCA